MNNPNPLSLDAYPPVESLPPERRSRALVAATQALAHRQAVRARRWRAAAGSAALLAVAAVLALSVRAPEHGVRAPRAGLQPGDAAPAQQAPIVHRAPEAFAKADVRVIDDYELRSILESAGYRVEIVRGPDAVLVRIDGRTFSLPAP